MNFTNIANRTDVSPQMISQIFSGKKNASPPLADKLEAITGVPARAWMLGGDVSKRRLDLSRKTDTQKAVDGNRRTAPANTGHLTDEEYSRLGRTYKIRMAEAREN